ncbi:MAG: UvrD-helicase domain-containing protein [Cytophagales bacterium]|nr:UvrD-helicase domain-containing protein [Armatimonadota bacterium]
MSENGWSAARGAARESRLRADAATGDPCGTAAALTAALDAAALRPRPRLPHDALLHGAHAVLDSEAQTVWYRADAPPDQRALLLAHELGHFHLHQTSPDHDALCRCCDEADLDEDPGLAAVGYGPRQRRESEANVWAREFLLPVPLAHHLFHGEGMSARAIATSLDLPPGVVLAQLGASLGFSPPAPFGANDSVGRGLGVLGVLAPPGIAPPKGAGGEKPKDALDPSQREAARGRGGPLLVGAGPGTGKTRTLTERVLFLVRERGVAPENLLGLTFSRKAADEMRGRIEARDPEIGRRAAISTFHAFGLDLLRRYWREADLPPRPVLLSEVEALTLLERRVGQVALGPLRYLHDPAYPLPDTLRAIARIKEAMLSPTQFAERAELSGDDKLRDVAHLYTAYEALLREKGALDYADLVCRALRLLQKSEPIRRAEQGRWQHVLVDEYQDVNRAGALLVRVLTRGGTGLWAVGDLRQAIYAFRGASPANVARFREDFPGGARTDLAVNYRSRPPLVALFGEAAGEGVDAWQAARNAASLPVASIERCGEGGVIYAISPSDQGQADGMAVQMRAFVQAGYAFGDQVVLCRTHGQARQMRAALREREIPVATDASEISLLSHRDVRELLTLLSRACEPSGAARGRFPELPRGLGSVPGDAYDFLATALWGEPGLARRIEEPAQVVPLLALALAFRERAAILLGPSEDPRRAFLAHLRRRVRLGAALGGESPEVAETDAVRVLTVHASKGLEFPVVFVPNLSAGKFPSRPGPSLLPPLPLGEVAEADEESRLFFVAITRARDYLVLSRAEKYNNRSAQPSPLLTWLEGDAAERLVERVRWEVPEPPRENETAEKPDTDTHTRREAGAASLPVSASDVELYLRCPRRYYYQRVREFPVGDRSAYSAFRHAVRIALEDADPVTALRAAWSEQGPEATHPHADLYRAAAEQIARKAAVRDKAAPPSPPRRSSATTKSQTVSLRTEHGVVSVEMEGLSADGSRLECLTFRKAPAGGEEAAPEIRQSLLMEAIRQESGGKSIPIAMHYLQTGEMRPVADKPKLRVKHLALYGEALQGIQRQQWEPAPQEAGDCPDCPYFFLCPDE